jgi:hypothetical protein
MRWFLACFAATALLAAVGACGSQITVPDQGVVVTGCQGPAQCFRNDCPCTRAAVSTAACISAPICYNPTDPSTCTCTAVDLGITVVGSACLEVAQACVGRGAFCGGSGATCVAAGTKCGDASAVPPMLIATTGPALSPHCQFVDDVCCPGVDGGVSD